MANNLLVASGTATYAAGKTGQAMSGACATNNTVNATVNGFTFECWIKVGTGSTLVVALSALNWWFGVAANGTFVYTNGGGQQQATATAIRDGAWHHLAVTAAASTTAYVDGVQVGTTSETGPVTSFTSGGYPAIGVAGLNQAPSNYILPGQIDLVRYSSGLRYAGAFAPPTSYTDDSSTIALYNLDGDLTDAHATASALTNTVAPAITGTAQVGQTLTVSNGTWSATPDSYTYQWNRAGTAIAGATSSTYSPVVGDVGSTLTCTVTAIKATYTNGSASSAATAAVVAASVTVIAPNDANLLYSPYTWLVGSSSAKTINAGAYFRALITGSPSAITATFDVSNNTAPLSQIAYRIDNGSWTVVPVAASVSLTLPSGNTWTKRLVEIRVKATSEVVNRWNAPQNTAVVFTGFSVTGTSPATGLIRRRKLNILCYGDSITEGVRALNSTATTDVDRNEGSQSWASPLAEIMGAEVGVVGFGSTAYATGGSGNVPAPITSYNLLWAGQARSFTPAPDLIAIHLGTNDTGDVTASATALLNALLAATSAATKIAVIQQWNNTTHASQLAAAIAASTAPTRVSYVDTTGWFTGSDSSDALHPYGYINLVDLAPRLALSLRSILGSARQFVNVGGAATPLTATIA